MRTDEWYTDEETVILCLEILDPKPKATILCPFDSEQSSFVKVLKAEGFTVIYGITDFFESELYECDYIMTNPPFSIKNAIIEKVFQYKKRTVLVLPLDVIGSKTRHKLFADNEDPQIYVPAGRISYFDENWIKRPSSNFHSIIATFNHGYNSGLTWETK
jgi:hypothetical protein